MSDTSINYELTSIPFTLTDTNTFYVDLNRHKSINPEIIPIILFTMHYNVK
jgi:hypothetical protein